MQHERGIVDTPDWYRDAIIYEVHVRAFADSNGDGIGDFKGLSTKLDYLRDLGVTAIWLLPFSPSPLRDDGYDTADYTAIHPNYGTLSDFKSFLRLAHERGLKVITELVLNHTSDQHPWFQRARHSPPDSKWRNFYVWSDKPDRYREARIIFTDTETSNWSWDPVANAYYWHRFFSHQPDLNFDSPHVRKAMLQVLDFWLKLGVDGLRLDAVPYLYERDGTNCENLPETHQFLRDLRSYVDRNYPNRMLLAEANQWPEDAVAYFGDGNECHMAFHFPVMPRMFLSLHMEDRFPIIDILNQTPPIPETCQWAMFLRNHDELTLEMVTDEDRDYMYRVYANDRRARINVGIRRRLAPLLANNRRRMELLNGLLLSLPGSPVIYYGDEIGMGDNIYLGDRNGVRTPMQWSADRNAGFSRANPQQLYLPVIIDPEYHYEAINVETQLNNPQSLLWWMRRLIALRKQYQAFGRGAIEFLHPHNSKVLAFIRCYEEETILVVANLSRFAQSVELDMSAYKGYVPVEVFGRTPFPPIGEWSYLLTLGPHAFYWFALQPGDMLAAQTHHNPLHENSEVQLTSSDWLTIFQGSNRQALEKRLPPFLQSRRWFGGKSRTIQGVSITRTIPIPVERQMGCIVLVEVRYTEGDPATYMLPLLYAIDDGARRIESDMPDMIVTRVRQRGHSEPGVLYDGLREGDFARALLEVMARTRVLRTAGSEQGEIVGNTTAYFRRATPNGAWQQLEPMLMRAEQSNTSLIFDDTFVLKVFRRLEPGINPELEMGRFLTERHSFARVPTLSGAIELRNASHEPTTIAVLQQYIQNEGDAWRYTLDGLGRYYERLLSHNHDQNPPSLPSTSPLTVFDDPVPDIAYDLIELYLPLVHLLGQRTAEMHHTLALGGTDDFMPEPFSTMNQRSLYQTARTQLVQTFQTLRKKQDTLPDGTQELAVTLLQREIDMLTALQAVLHDKLQSQRIRCHSDYHLGQVLYTGKDFVITDFEGEPVRSLSERRRKRSAMTDVAGMLRSFHYAAYTGLLAQVESGLVREEQIESLHEWAHFWYMWVSVVFLNAYFETAGNATFVPPTRSETVTLLRFFLLDKAVYELGYELNNRPTWVRIPLWGIQQVLDEQR